MSASMMLRVASSSAKASRLPPAASVAFLAMRWEATWISVVSSMARASCVVFLCSRTKSNAATAIASSSNTISSVFVLPARSLIAPDVVLMPHLTQICEPHPLPAGAAGDLTCCLLEFRGPRQCHHAEHAPLHFPELIALQHVTAIAAVFLGYRFQSLFV